MSDGYEEHVRRWGMCNWKHKQMVAKRFTDPELAAEVHRMDAELMAEYAISPDSQYVTDARARYWILHRFATLPSYDAEP